MKRVAFVFPGQGAQEVGMGRDLLAGSPLAGSPLAEQLLARASDLTGCDVKRLCQRGPEKKLRQTSVLQPALTAVCLGLCHYLEEEGIRPLVTAGHSLGEISALAASGFSDPEALIDLAALRGRVMERAAIKNVGSMVAVSGLSATQVEKTIESFKKEGALSIAAVNAPTQVTLSGDTSLLERAKDALRSHPDVKVTRLRVSGAWHSTHMAEAVDPFFAALQEMSFRNPRIKMVFNRHGEIEDDPLALPDLIGKQLIRPIRWDLVMEKFRILGVTDVFEIGPGRTLRGLCRLNPSSREMNIINVSSLRSARRHLDAVKHPS